MLLFTKFKLERRAKEVVGQDYILLDLSNKKAQYMHDAIKMPFEEMLPLVKEYGEITGAGYMTDARKKSFFQGVAEKYNVTPEKAIERYKNVKRLSRVFGPQVVDK